MQGLEGGKERKKVGQREPSQELMGFAFPLLWYNATPGDNTDRGTGIPSCFHCISGGGRVICATLVSLLNAPGWATPDRQEAPRTSKRGVFQLCLLYG